MGRVNIVIKFKMEIMKVQSKPIWLVFFIRELRAVISEDTNVFYVLSQSR